MTMTLNTEIKKSKKDIKAWEIFKNDPCWQEMLGKLTKLKNETLTSLLDEDSADDKYKKLLIKFISKIINEPEHIQSDLNNYLADLKAQKEEEEWDY